MFDHVTIRVADREASERFYGPLLATLGAGQTAAGGLLAEWDDFSPAKADAQHAHPRAAPRLLRAHPRARRRLLAGRHGARLPRRRSARPAPAVHADYDGAFLLDPDGNSAETVNHGRTRPDGAIDHRWIRVADVAAAKSSGPLCSTRDGHNVEVVHHGR